MNGMTRGKTILMCAAIAIIDSNGCTEVGTCQVARLGTPLDLRPPVERSSGALALRECSLGRLPGARAEGRPGVSGALAANSSRG